MAINTINATIQMRKGLERDFDADQMTAGEFAVSTDTKYVRMCFEPGIVLRMATYDGFEADMVQVREILKECQDIQVAVDAMADIAEQHKDDAEAYAKLSESWARGGTGTRPGENTNSSKYFSSLSESYAKGTNGQLRPGDNEDSAKGYYEKTKQIAQGVNGLIPMGTIAFADLPTSNILQGAMYNISDDFTSDNRFIDGGGKYYGSGSNVYWIETDQKWDVTAASGVSGVKGDKESSYRQGFINLTPEDIGAATIEDLDGVNPDFVGTKAELEQKIASGEIKDGATAFLRDGQYGDELEPNRAIISNETGDITTSSVTAEEIGFLSGVTSNIQTQIDNSSVIDWDKINQFCNSVPVPANVRRRFFRGKSLGTSFTDAQKQAISSGKFDDMFIGDYWDINSHRWRIWDINYWLRKGDTSCTTPHILVGPDSNLYSHVMNDTNTTEGAYKGSKMATGGGLTQAYDMLAADFGVAYLLNHRELVTNAVANGKPSSGEWIDSDVILMNEFMVYGHSVFLPTSDGTTVSYNYTIDTDQLAIFQLWPEYQNFARSWYWLRDVVSATDFTDFSDGGDANYYRAADSSGGVRPVCGIHG